MQKVKLEPLGNQMIQILNNQKMIAFAYYGAKNGLLKDLLPLLPQCAHYCEPFAGSATVLLNRAPSPIETINDLNGDIVNFFAVLRDRGDELVQKLSLTPYARAEFSKAWGPADCPVERARRFCVRVQMDIAKAGQKRDRSWSCNVTYIQNAHSYAVRNFHKKIGGMGDVINRLKNVQIDCRPAIECIAKFDSPRTLFYCDPPYVAQTRKSANDYQVEMDDQEHYLLSLQLMQCKGKVALSGYDSGLYAELYSGWTKTLFRSRRVPMSKSGLVRQECLWTNYEPSQYGVQASMQLK